MDEPEPPELPPFRFSLRLMLLLVALFAAVVASLGVYLQLPPSEYRIARDKEIKRIEDELSSGKVRYNHRTLQKLEELKRERAKEFRLPWQR